jgi:hypothetical protein
MKSVLKIFGSSASKQSKNISKSKKLSYFVRADDKCKSFLDWLTYSEISNKIEDLEKFRKEQLQINAKNNRRHAETEKRLDEHDKWWAKQQQINAEYDKRKYFHQVKLIVILLLKL